jgi:hypothetical protein
MFFNTEDKTKDGIIKELELNIELLNKRYDEARFYKNDLEDYKKENLKLKEENAQLKADKTLLEGQVEIAKDKAKSEWAEHVMKIEDERLSSIEKAYNTFTDKTLEIVKASIQPARIFMNTQEVKDNK